MGVLGRAKDFVLVFAERFDPGLHIRRVLFRIVWNTPFRRKKDAGKLGPQFFLCVVRIAKAVAFVERWPIQAVSRWPLQWANSWSAVP